MVRDIVMICFGLTGLCGEIKIRIKDKFIK